MPKTFFLSALALAGGFALTAIGQPPKDKPEPPKAVAGPKAQKEAVERLLKAGCAVHYEESPGAKNNARRRLAAKARFGLPAAPDKATPDKLDIVAFPKAVTDKQLADLVVFAQRLPGLKTVDLGQCSNVTAAGLKEVARIGHLQAILLDGCSVDREGLQHLAALKGLSVLDLSNTTVTDRDLGALADYPSLGTLYLKNAARVNAEGIAALQKVARLRTLHLTVHNDPPGMMAEVARLGLTELKAYPITDEEAKEIGKLRSLESLDVGHYPFADYDAYQWTYWRGWGKRSAAAVAAEERAAERQKAIEARMTEAERQKLKERAEKVAKDRAGLGKMPRPSSYHNITAKGLAEIVKCSELRVLDVSGHPIDPSTSDLHKLEFLQDLDLTGTRFSDAGAPWLGKLKALKTLRIGATLVTTDGVRELAYAGGLETLSLDLLPIGDEAIGYLSRNRKLKELTVNGTRVACADRRALSELVRLEWFEVEDTNVTDSTLMNLAPLKTLFWVDARMNCPNVTWPGAQAVQRELGPDATVVAHVCEGYWP
ncbi:MAG TPA: hypothetical protein VM597_25205, partial [Gemmataceae bacterium]|nr:hypothetical protein [Gemmataceae bacterium]